MYYSVNQWNFRLTDDRCGSRNKRQVSKVMWKSVNY